MLHTFQADFYQLFRSKGFWITEGLLFLYILLNSLTRTSFYLLDSSSEKNTTINHETIQGWTGFQALHELSNDSLSFIVISILVLIAFLLGKDLSKKLYRNVLSAGVSRSRYYIFKKIEIIILAFCQLIFSYIFAFLISSLFNGFGSVSREFLNSLSEIFIQNFVYVLACVSVTIFILYLTHSMTFAYLGFISLLILQAGVILLFPLLNMNLFSYGVILICLWGGYQAFQHRDL